MEKQHKVEEKQAHRINNLSLIIQKKLFILISPVSLLLVYLPALIIFLDPRIIIVVIKVVLGSPTLDDKLHQSHRVF